MSDDLVKHLRNSNGWPTLGNAAADRIEELELEVETWKSRAIHQNEVAGRSEAKLAKLEAAAQKAVGHITGYGEASTARIELRTTLAELTGGKDE